MVRFRRGEERTLDCKLHFPKNFNVLKSPSFWVINFGYIYWNLLYKLKMSKLLNPIIWLIESVIFSLGMYIILSAIVLFLKTQGYFTVKLSTNIKTDSSKRIYLSSINLPWNYLRWDRTLSPWWESWTKMRRSCSTTN